MDVACNVSELKTPQRIDDPTRDPTRFEKDGIFTQRKSGIFDGSDILIRCKSAKEMEDLGLRIQSVVTSNLDETPSTTRENQSRRARIKCYVPCAVL
jgi:hypothetical protein